jgi:uncharacterized protein involved in type VI secretion and phage assembly
MGLPHRNDGSDPGYFGVYPAIVTDIVDPDSLGRVQVRFPWLGTTGDQDVRAWATLCTPYADDRQGFLVLPEVDSQVVVAFEAGNLRRPYVVGSVWNGRETLPHSPEAANNIRILRTRRDSRLEFDDSTGAEKVTISTSSGHQVVLDNSAREVLVNHADGCSVKLTSTGVEVQANVTVDVTATIVSINAPISMFDGIVTAKTFIAESAVVSPSYTPGAGNIW